MQNKLFQRLHQIYQAIDGDAFARTIAADDFDNDFARLTMLDKIDEYDAEIGAILRNPDPLGVYMGQPVSKNRYRLDVPYDIFSPRPPEYLRFHGFVGTIRLPFRNHRLRRMQAVADVTDHLVVWKHLSASFSVDRIICYCPSDIEFLRGCHFRSLTLCLDVDQWAELFHSADQDSYRFINRALNDFLSETLVELRLQSSLPFSLEHLAPWLSEIVIKSRASATRLRRVVLNHMPRADRCNTDQIYCFSSIIERMQGRGIALQIDQSDSQYSGD